MMTYTVHCTPDVSLAARVKQQKQILDVKDTGAELAFFCELRLRADCVTVIVVADRCSGRRHVSSEIDELHSSHTACT
jgi:hypothetical protein